MNNKILKVCWIREPLSNYDWINLLWFNFIDISKRKITKEKAKSIETPNTVMRIWLFWKYDQENRLWQRLTEVEIDEIIRIAKETNMRWLQIYSKVDFWRFKRAWFYMIYPISYDEIDSFIPNENIDMLVIDGKNPGSWEWYDFRSLAEKRIKKPFLLAWWINEVNILKIKKDVPNCIWFDLASGVDNLENIDEEKVKIIINKLETNV